MAEVARLNAVFTADTRQFDTALAHVNSGLQNTVNTLGGRLQSLGKSMSQLGRGTLLAAAPLLAIGAAATRASIDFETAFAGVVKTVNGTEEELNGLRDTIREMATDSSNPLSGMESAHLELAKIMEVAGQLGVEVDALEEFAETMAMLAMSTDLTAEDAATLAAQFGNITGMDFANVDNFAAALVDLGNNSATTESAIMNMAMRLAAAGKAAGFSEDETLAFAAALSSVGVTAELGGGNMSRFLNTITRATQEGGPALQELASAAGMTADEFKQAFEEDAAGAVAALLASLDDMNAAERMAFLEDIGLSGSEAADVVGRLAENSEGVAEALDRSAAAWQDNTALITEASARADTTQGNINKLKNNMYDLGIAIGDTLVPALNAFLDAIIPIVQDISRWAKENPEVSQTVGALATAVGALGAAMVVLGPIVGALGTGLKILGAIFTALATPIVAVVAAGVALGIAIWQLLETTGVATTIRDVFGAAFEQIGTIINGVINVIVGVVDAAKAVGAEIPKILNSIKDIFAGVFGAIEDIINSALDVINDIIGGIQDVAEGAQDVLTSLGHGGGSSILSETRGEIRSRARAANAGGMADMGNAMLNAISGFGGPRAEGGPVTAGRSYLVGERGPELFTPSASGAITPNGAGGMTIQQVVVQASNLDELYSQLERVGSRRS